MIRPWEEHTYRFSGKPCRSETAVQGSRKTLSNEHVSHQHSVFALGQLQASSFNYHFPCVSFQGDRGLAGPKGAAGEKGQLVCIVFV